MTGGNTHISLARSDATQSSFTVHFPTSHGDAISIATFENNEIRDGLSSSATYTTTDANETKGGHALSICKVCAGLCRPA
jgi:hypothetical protein